MALPGARSDVLSRLVPRSRSLDRDRTTRRYSGCVPGERSGSRRTARGLTEAVRSCWSERGYRAAWFRLEEARPTAVERTALWFDRPRPQGAGRGDVRARSFGVLRAAARPSNSGRRGGAALLTVSRLDGTFGLNGLAMGRMPFDRRPGGTGQDGRPRMARSPLQGGRSRPGLRFGGASRAGRSSSIC